MIELLVGEAKRRRAAAVQDAGALTESSRTARSVLECARPLALWAGGLVPTQRRGAGRNDFTFSTTGIFERRRRGILVAPVPRKNPSSVGATYPDDAAPTELMF